MSLGLAGPGSYEHVSLIEGERLRRGLTEVEVQDATGLHRKTLARLERCDPGYTPRADVWNRLAKLYNLPPAELLNDFRRRQKEQSDG